MNNGYYESLGSETKTYEFKKSERILAWLMILLGYLIVRIMPTNEKRLGAMLVYLALWVSAYAYARITGRKPNIKDNFIMTASVAMLPSLIITSDVTTTFCTSAGELVLYMYYISTVGRNRKLDDTFWADTVRSLLKLPFCAMGALPKAIVPEKKSDAGKKVLINILWVLLGLCAAIVPTIIIAEVLTYDASFSSLLDRITDINIEDFTERIPALLFAFPIAMFVFGNMTASRDENDGENKIKNVEFIPAAVVYAAMTPILAVYVLFFVSQWDMYMSAFTGVLPEGITYAGYAREGFFQLFGISVFNGIMLLCISLFVKRESKAAKVLMKIYMTVTSLMTLALIATALSKMLLYIDAYGLTLKRINTTWFMAVLAFAFVYVIISQFVKKFNFTGIMLVTFAILFAVLAYSNTEALVANYNADAYLSGKTANVDVSEIYDMSDSGVTALLRLREESKDENVRKKAANFISMYAKDHKDEKHGIFTFNIPRYKAEKAMKNFG